MNIEFKLIKEIPSLGSGTKLAFDDKRLALVRGSVIKVRNLDGFFHSYRFPGYQFHEIQFTEQEDCFLISPYKVQISSKVLTPDNLLLDLKKQLYPSFLGDLGVTVAKHSPEATYIIVGLECRPTKRLTGNSDGILELSKPCIALIEAETGKLISRVHESHFPYSTIAVSHSYFASASIEGVFLFNIPSGNRLMKFDNDSLIFKTLYFLENRNFLIAGSLTGVIKIWDVLTKEEKTVFKAHKGEVTGLSFHPMLHLLITIGDDNYCRFWDINNIPKKISELKLPGAVSEIELSILGDSIVFVTGSFGDTIQIYSMQVEI